MLDNYNYGRQQQYRRGQQPVGNSIYKMQQNTTCNTCNPCDNDPVCEIPNPVLATAYVVNQKWGSVYEPCKALNAGTIFPALDLPFLGRSCGRR